MLCIYDQTIVVKKKKKIMTSLILIQQHTLVIYPLIEKASIHFKHPADPSRFYLIKVFLLKNISHEKYFKLSGF